MNLIRPGIRVELDPLLVDKSDLNSLSLQVATLFRIGTGGVVHVVVNTDKFAHDGLHDIQSAPFFGIEFFKMKFRDDHVDLIQVAHWEVLEPRELPSLAVHLQYDPLIDQCMILDDILKSYE